ncbi:MAG: hypothetical protein QXW47_10020 [Candidatus Jordarchaeales archaeon]
MYQDTLDEVRVLERYIILLLGVVDRPIPSLEHLQKELFILSRVNPRVAELIHFEKHYKGPFSQNVAEVVNNPVYYTDAFRRDREGRCWITPEGKKIYEELVRENAGKPGFSHLLAVMKAIRELYDALSKEELLFLIYVTYPEYQEKSSFSDQLLSPERKRKIAEKLLEKGLITEERYRELVGSDEQN